MSRPPDRSLALWHSLQVSSNSSFVAAVKAAWLGGPAAAGRAVAGRAPLRAAAVGAGEGTRVPAAAGGACSDDLMFTAMSSTVDATPIATACSLIPMPLVRGQAWAPAAPR